MTPQYPSNVVGPGSIPGLPKLDITRCSLSLNILNKKTEKTVKVVRKTCHQDRLKTVFTNDASHILAT